MSHLYRLQIPCFQTLSGHTGPVTCCAFDADGRSICTGGEDGDIRLWRFVGDSYRCAKVIELGPAITCCQFQPSGFEDLLATGSTDNVLRIWKAFEGDCIKTLQGHAEQVSSLSFNPMNGDLIVSGSHDLTARVWRVSKEKHLKELRGHKGPVVLCCYNPNGELVLTASQDKTLRLWNPKTGESVAVLKGHSKLVWGAAFHTKTEWIITGGQDKLLKLWRESDGSFVKDFPGHAGTIYSVAFDQGTGEILASAEGDGPAGRTNVIWIWHFESGIRKSSIKAINNTHVLKGHTARIRCLAFGMGDSLLCSASDDGTARLWKFGSTVGGGGGGGGGGVASAAAAAAATAREEGASARPAATGAKDSKKQPTKSRWEIKKEMGLLSGNPLKDFVEEVKDQYWDWMYEDGKQEGVQSHEFHCTGRINAGHENVYGWVDDKESTAKEEESMIPCKQQ